jgi:chromosomal replication initiation ATPase DnaA
VSGAAGRQLTFALEGPPRFTEEDFLVAPANAQPHALLTSWPAWPSRAVLLTGPHGAGKSHLAAIWTQRSQAPLIEAADLTLDHIAQLEPDMPLAVENVDHPSASETVLFHLLNAARERRLWLLLTAGEGARSPWPHLPDLASRLRALPRAELEAPGDELVRAVLVKLFDDRQLAVDADVVDYVARRMERSLGAARNMVAALDREALALKRAITRPMAAAVLTQLTHEQD